MKEFKFYDLSRTSLVDWCTHWHLRTKDGGYRGKHQRLSLEATLRMLKPVDGKTVQVEYQSARYTWYRVNLTLRLKEVLGKHFIVLEIDAIDGFIPGSHDPSLYDYFCHGLESERPIQNWPSLNAAIYLNRFSKDAILDIQTEEAHKAYVCGEDILYPWATPAERWIHEWSRYLTIPEHAQECYTEKIRAAKETLPEILDFLDIYNGTNLVVHAVGKDNKDNPLDTVIFTGTLDEYINSDRSFEVVIKACRKSGVNPYFFDYRVLEFGDKMFKISNLY